MRARPGRGRWRQTVDSFGGFLTIGAVGGAILIVLLLVLRNPLTSVSEDQLLGEELSQGAGASHTDNVANMVARPGEPPVNGPHFGAPWPTGIFDRVIPDGNVVHSLEHGIVWFSYNPELTDGRSLEILEDVASDFRGDVILSERPQNEMAIAAVSWGRLLALDEADEEVLRDFVRTNRNRSPEPGIR